MKDPVTVILPIRNREPERIRSLVLSLRGGGADPIFLIVDYGSEAGRLVEYRRIALELGLEIEAMEAQGLPWNKCRAINRGARMATTEFVASSDIDMLYDENPLPWCLERGVERRCFHIDSYWLGPEGDRARAGFAGHGSPGGFQLIRRSAFEEAGGYDEGLVYWGLEDLDWPARLSRLGWEQTWLPASFRAYHQWHPISEARGSRPLTASYDNARRCVRNLASPRLEQEWGRPLCRQDRPILDLIDAGARPAIIAIEADRFVEYRGFERILAGRAEHEYQRLEFGSRFEPRPLEAFRDFARFFLRPVAAISGNALSDRTNSNFDYFHAILDALIASGLRDYFISDARDAVNLLW